ncbi:hypothetical protein GCM10023310_69140 [Paenibacillus vulneris]|uniref:Phage ABA sandwich domain-containing protein n=1 Tax=Paenibacillus vulneris TaxID=1133364 RepID=A0ABW3UIG3_9BACL
MDQAVFTYIFEGYIEKGEFNDWYCYKESKTYKSSCIPFYSSDMSKAWEVVDYLNHDQKHLVWHEREKQWVFIFGKGTWGRWSAWADKPEEAICKAALLYKFNIQSF